MSASPSSHHHRSSNRVWFEYKGKLDCVKGNFDYIADVKQAIHKKLGTALSSTSLDLELYLPNTVVSLDDRSATTNLRDLRSDMRCTNCYGVNLLSAESSSSPSSLSTQQQSPTHIVAMTVPVGGGGGGGGSNNNVLSGGFGNNNNHDHHHHHDEFSPHQQQRPDSSMQQHFDLADVGVVDDDEPAGVAAGRGTDDDAYIDAAFSSPSRGGGGGGGSGGHRQYQQQRPSSTSSAPSVRRQILDSNNRISSTGDNNPRNTRLMMKAGGNSQTYASQIVQNNIMQQQQSQHSRVVTVGVDVVTSLDTKTIIGAVTMELPVADVRAASSSSLSARNQNQQQQQFGLFFNRYVLERCRDAMTKNVALAASRVTCPRLTRVMLYDSDFGEYVLFSEATNSASFPIFTTVDTRNPAKLIGRPSLLAVVDFPATCASAEVIRAGIIVTAPLYIAVSSSSTSTSASSSFLGGGGGGVAATTESTEAEGGGGRMSMSPTTASTTPEVYTRPASKVAFQPPVAASSSSLAAGGGRPHSAVVSSGGSSNNRTNFRSSQQQQQQQAAKSRPWSAGATTAAAAASSSSSSFRNGDPPVLHSYYSQQQQYQQYRHHHDAAHADNTEQMKTADAIVRKVSPTPPPPPPVTGAASPSSPAFAKTQEQQREQIEALVNRLSKVSQQHRDEAERCKQLEEVLAERQLKHEEHLNQVRLESEAKFQEEHEYRMQNLNAQLDGQIQELHNEIYTLKQRNKNNGLGEVTADDVSELRRKVARYEAEIDSLNTKRNKLEEHLESAAVKFDELKRANGDVSDQLEKVKKEKFILKQDLEAQMEANGALREMTVLQLKVEELEQSCAVLQRDRKAAHKELQKKTDALILVERRADDAERELSTFREQWSEENMAKTKRIADLTQKLENATAQQSYSANTAGHAVKSADAAKHEVDEVRTQLLELSLQLDAEKKRCAELVQEKMQNQIEDSFRSKALDLTRQNLALMQERDAAKQRLWETEHNLREAKTQNQTAQARRQAEELQHQAQSSTSRLLLEENAELQTKLSTALEVSHQSNVVIDTLKQEIEIERANALKVKPLQERVAQLNSENSELRRRLDELKKTLQQGQQTGTTLSKEQLAALQVKEQEYLDQLAQQKTEFIDEKERQIQELNDAWQEKLDSAVAKAVADARLQSLGGGGGGGGGGESGSSSSNVFGFDSDEEAAAKAKKMGVLLKISKALRASSREEVKSLETEKGKLEVEHSKEKKEMQDDVAHARRETFCKEESVRRAKIEEEYLYDINTLQKVFEDEVLKHIADLAMQDTFSLDDEFSVAPAPPTAQQQPRRTSSTVSRNDTFSLSTDTFHLSDASMVSSSGGTLSASPSPDKKSSNNNGNNDQQMLASFRLPSDNKGKASSPTAKPAAPSPKKGLKADDTMNWSTFTIDDDPNKSMMMKSSRSMRQRMVKLESPSETELRVADQQQESSPTVKEQQPAAVPELQLDQQKTSTATTATAAVTTKSADAPPAEAGSPMNTSFAEAADVEKMAQLAALQQQEAQAAAAREKKKKEEEEEAEKKKKAAAAAAAKPEQQHFSLGSIMDQSSTWDKPATTTTTTKPAAVDDMMAGEDELSDFEFDEDF